MSWLSKATGIHLGNIGAPIGAAIGSVIPGVGTEIGAGLGGAVGSLGSHHSVGDALKTGAISAAGAGALGGIGSHIPGLSSLGSIASHIPGVGAAESAFGSVPGLSSLGDWVKGHGLQLLEGAQGVNAAMQGRKANQLQNNALATAEQSYNERAPLRAAGMQGMLHPQVPSLSPLADPGNPYSKAPISYPSAPGVSPVGR